MDAINGTYHTGLNACRTDIPSAAEVLETLSVPNQ